MKENDKKNNILEVFLLVLAMSFFGLFSAYFFPFLLLLFPVGFVIFALRRDIVLSGIAMVVSFIAISLAVGPAYGILLFIMFFPLTICLIYMIKKRKKSIEIIGFSAAVFFISILIVLNFVDAAGIGFVAQLEDSFKGIIETQIDMFKDMDLTNYELAETKELLENAYKYILLIIPSIMLMFALVVSYLNYLISALGLKRLRVKIANIPKFARFSLPKNVVPGVIIMFLAIFIAGNLGFGYTDTINLNLVALIGFMVFIQGLAVVEHLFKKMNMFLVLRIILYILFLFTAFMLTFISIIGALDLVFDFRKLRRPKSS